jgi:ribosomal protein S18 acetylase RimI-like enzyme
MFEYTEARPGLDELSALLAAAGLNAPLSEPNRLEQMFSCGYVLVARQPDGGLAGVIRVLTDNSYNAFVADLAVAPQAQGRGVGSSLLRHATERHSGVKFVVHPADATRLFFEKNGFVSAPTAMVLPRRH